VAPPGRVVQYPPSALTCGLHSVHRNRAFCDRPGKPLPTMLQEPSGPSCSITGNRRGTDLWKRTPSHRTAQGSARVATAVSSVRGTGLPHPRTDAPGQRTPAQPPCGPSWTGRVKEVRWRHEAFRVRPFGRAHEEPMLPRHLVMAGPGKSHPSPPHRLHRHRRRQRYFLPEQGEVAARQPVPFRQWRSWAAFSKGRAGAAPSGPRPSCPWTEVVLCGWSFSCASSLP